MRRLEEEAGINLEDHDESIWNMDKHDTIIHAIDTVKKIFGKKNIHFVFEGPGKVTPWAVKFVQEVDGFAQTMQMSASDIVQMARENNYRKIYQGFEQQTSDNLKVALTTALNIVYPLSSDRAGNVTDIEEYTAARQMKEDRVAS